LEKKLKKLRAVLASALAGFAAAGGQAAQADDAGWYGGLSVGQSRAKIHDARNAAQLLGAGLSTTSIDDNDRDTGFKLLAGKKFNRNFAVEGGYFNLGEFGFTANTAPPGSLTGNIKLQGLNLDAVGILPFTEKFSAFGRVGLTYTEAKDTFRGTGAVTVSNPNPKKSEANYKVGAGLQYDFTRALALRGEWERYRINDAIGNKGDIDMVSVGLIYRFGTEKPAPRAATPPPYVAPAPVPVAAAPAPAPLLVIVPIVAKTQQYCSILDIQFDINQKTVRHEMDERIEKVAVFMRKYPDTTAVIEGHTDEVGPSADNMQLSQTRADNVVSYLAGRGIARSRLKAEGYGETRPLADNRTEIGKRLNRRINAIIACATDIEGITPVATRITMALEMEFDTNSADVRPQYRGELRKVANFMKANPKVIAMVEGHTSKQQGGSAAENLQLSQRRAESVVNALADQFDVDRTRLFAEGFGGTRRFAYNTSIEGRQENRRVNILFDFNN
jgi:OOP family OmpA-OmpF porin